MAHVRRKLVLWVDIWFFLRSFKSTPYRTCYGLLPVEYDPGKRPLAGLTWSIAHVFFEGNAQRQLLAPIGWLDRLAPCESVAPPKATERYVNHTPINDLNSVWGFRRVSHRVNIAISGGNEYASSWRNGKYHFRVEYIATVFFFRNVFQKIRHNKFLPDLHSLGLRVWYINFGSHAFFRSGYSRAARHFEPTHRGKKKQHHPAPAGRKAAGWIRRSWELNQNQIRLLTHGVMWLLGDEKRLLAGFKLAATPPPPPACLLYGCLAA